MQKFISILLVLLGSAGWTNIAIAAERSLSNLPSKYCQDYNATISFAGSDDYTCFLVFEPANDTPNGTIFEYEFTVLLKGNLVHFYRAGPRFPSNGKHIFESKDKKIRISFSTKVVSDSCVEGEDKCCGANEKGQLILETPRGIEKYKIQFYRGG
jgi:hypothetical protein